MLGFKIDNLTNELSDRSKIIFSSAFSLANKYETHATSFHILYIILEDSEKYINDILGALTSNVDVLKSNIFLLLNKNKQLSRSQKIDKSILTLINTSKILLKQ